MPAPAVTVAPAPASGFAAFLVIGEIATTLVILVGAGLLGRSFLRLIATSPGFSQQNLITMEFSLPTPQWPDRLDQSGIAAPGLIWWKTS